MMREVIAPGHFLTPSPNPGSFIDASCRIKKTPGEHPAPGYMYRPGSVEILTGDERLPQTAD